MENIGAGKPIQPEEDLEPWGWDASCPDLLPHTQVVSRPHHVIGSILLKEAPGATAWTVNKRMLFQVTRPSSRRLSLWLQCFTFDCFGGSPRAPSFYLNTLISNKEEWGPTLCPISAAVGVGNTGFPHSVGGVHPCSGPSVHSTPGAGIQPAAGHSHRLWEGWGPSLLHPTGKWVRTVSKSIPLPRRPSQDTQRGPAAA